MKPTDEELEALVTRDIATLKLTLGGHDLSEAELAKMDTQEYRATYKAGLIEAFEICERLNDPFSNLKDFLDDAQQFCESREHDLHHLGGSKYRIATPTFGFPVVIDAVWNNELPDDVHGYVSFKEGGDTAKLMGILYGYLERGLHIANEPTTLVKGMQLIMGRPAVYGAWRIFPERSNPLYVVAISAARETTGVFDPSQSSATAWERGDPWMYFVEGDVHEFLGFDNIVRITHGIEPEVIAIRRAQYTTLTDKVSLREFGPYALRHLGVSR